MKKSQRLAGLASAAGLALVASLGAAALLSPAHASTYAPGTASTQKPAYDPGWDRYSYSCDYAGWRAGAIVTWHCDLYGRYFDEASGGFIKTVLIKPNSGSWTPPPKTHSTPTYYYKIPPAEAINLCTRAYALSVDGGSTVVQHCD